MKLTEKILRRPLPDQLKALLEKFDGDFDASHLRALKDLSDEPSFTRYEQFMLKRAYKDARVKLDRNNALNTAMSVVLNLKEEIHSGWYSNPAMKAYPNVYPSTRVDKEVEEVRRELKQKLAGISF